MAYTNNDIRKLLNLVSKKEKEGFLSYDNFNVLLKTSQRSYFDLNLRNYFDDWKARHTLRPFRVEQNNLNQSGSVSYGIFTDIAKIIEARNDQNRFIETIEDTGEWYDRLDMEIKAPTDKYPVCRLQSGSLELQPSTTALKDIIYIRYPATPVLDGMFSENTLEFQYLSAGASVDLDTTYDGWQAIDGTTAGTYNSKTVECEFYDEDKIEIAGLMLATLGITYNKQSLFEYMKLVNE